MAEHLRPVLTFCFIFEPQTMVIDPTKTRPAKRELSQVTQEGTHFA